MHSCLWPSLMPSMQSIPQCIGAPPLRSQDRPRMGRDDSDVPRVQWGAYTQGHVCATRSSSVRKTTNLQNSVCPRLRKREPKEEPQTAKAAVCATLA